MQDVIGVILSGGQGQRLFPLTKFRSKPAVPLGGKYRLIDIPISNCLNSRNQPDFRPYPVQLGIAEQAHRSDL